MKPLLITGLLCLALSGCGQRGPLYFPEAPAAAPAAAEADSEDEAEAESGDTAAP